MAPTYFIRNSAQVSELLLLWPELLVESVSRLATVLDRERPPRLESTDLLFVLISLLWELLLLCRFLPFRNIFHHCVIRRRCLRIQMLYFTVTKGPRRAACTRLPFILTWSAFSWGTACLAAASPGPPAPRPPRVPAPGGWRPGSCSRSNSSADFSSRPARVRGGHALETVRMRGAFGPPQVSGRGVVRN